MSLNICNFRYICQSFVSLLVYVPGPLTPPPSLPLLALPSFFCTLCSFPYNPLSRTRCSLLHLFFKIRGAF